MKSSWKMTQINGQKVLIPASENAATAANLGLGKDHVIDIFIERNANQFKLYQMLLEFTANHCDQFDAPAALDQVLKIRLGHTETYIDHSGKKGIKPSSIAMDAMDQVEFNHFFNRAIDLISTEFVPTFKDEFQAEFWEFLA